MRPSSNSIVFLATWVALVDTGTKAVAFTVLDEGQRAGPVVPLRNHDALLGIVSGSVTRLVVVGTIVLLAAAAVTIRLAQHRRVSWFVPGLMIGGATANLLDRIVFGYVHDWLHVAGVVINLADVAVAMAVVGYTAGLIRNRDRSFPERQPAPAEH